MMAGAPLNKDHMVCYPASGMHLEGSGGMEPAVVKSARRTLEILELFSLLHRSASVKEISQTLGYPQSSTSVLLAGLARLGYLEQDPADRTYRPTLKVMLLSGWSQDQLIGEGSLVRRLDELRHSTGLAVLLAMRWGIRAQYLITLRPSSGTYSLRAGVVRPIGRTGVGKALLMQLSEAEASKILRRANAEEPDLASRVSVAGVLADLRASRARGWTESNGAFVAHMNTIAMPLPILPKHPPLAVAVGVPMTNSDALRPQVVSALRKFCTAVDHDFRADVMP